MSAKLKDTGVLIVICSLSTQEAEAGGQPGLHSKTLSEVEVVGRNRRGLAPVILVSCVVLAIGPASPNLSFCR